MQYNKQRQHGQGNDKGQHNRIEKRQYGMLLCCQHQVEDIGDIITQKKEALPTGDTVIRNENWQTGDGHSEHHRDVKIQCGRRDRQSPGGNEAD